MSSLRALTAGQPWSSPWLQLPLILVAATLLRVVFFVGFGLGDDLAYIGHADVILNGGYPPLDPLNQYAYRPLLLYLFAGGIALFGYTDQGVVAPVLLAGIATTALVYVFVRRLIDPGAAWWCALLFAFEPFNVVNSTTMTNDVILSFLTFAALALFLTADLSSLSTSQRARRFVAGGALMFAAFLVKITIAPVLAAIGLYSLLVLVRRPQVVLKYHLLFYAVFLAGICVLCFVYFQLKGDPLWQFRAERSYYEAYKPDWYLAGAIDYASLLWYYPRSLFGLSGFGGFFYRDHGFLFWLAMPAMAVAVLRGGAVLRFLVAVALIVFAFFQFYPQYLTPRYLPLVRQDRYLELLLPPVVVIVGTALYRLSRRHPGIAAVVLCALLGNFVVEASRRWLMFDDSQRDVRTLALYAKSTIAATGKPLAADMPAANALGFYLRGTKAQVERVGRGNYLQVSDAYVAVGGARSFWWAHDQVFDVRADAPPGHWLLTYQVPGEPRPWRRSTLRVYYAAGPDGNATNASILPTSTPPSSVPQRGLRLTAHAQGFDTPGVLVTDGAIEPEINNRVEIPASRLQWDGWLKAENALYTIESRSDDGSWLYLNGELILDNGGTHPARTARRTIRLAAGWYPLRLRYEDTGGDRLLQLRVFRDHLPDPLDPGTLFFSFPDRLP